MDACGRYGGVAESSRWTIGFGLSPALALNYRSYPARNLGDPSAAIRPITSEEGLTRTEVCIM